MPRGELSIQLSVDYEHWPILDGVSRSARLLHVDALCLCAMLDSDGLLTTDEVVRLGAPSRSVVALRLAQELVDSGAWTVRPAYGYVVSLEEVSFYLRGTNRPHIPKLIRAAVYQRDGYACVICGSADQLSLDHIKPYSQGGQDTVPNLRVLCLPCNWARGAGRW